MRSWLPAIRTSRLLYLSEEALDAVRNRIGRNSTAVRMSATDLRQWTPLRTYAVWHDRAVLHILTDSEGENTYIDWMTAGTRAESTVIVSALAPDGPERAAADFRFVVIRLPIWRRFSANRSILMKAARRITSRRAGHAALRYHGVQTPLSKC
jgi:hypothetical protein